MGCFNVTYQKKKIKDDVFACVHALCVSCKCQKNVIAVLKLCMKQYAGTKCTLDYAHGCKKTASLVVFPYKTVKLFKKWFVFEA